MTRALAMISGGLDSILAAKLIKEQGIDVIGICFKSYFFSEESAIKMTKQIDIPLVVVDFSKEHFKLVRNPKHGRGKNMNPCIDCHAMMMNYAGELLKQYDADFIITGEVLNQRPMSQNRQALDIVKKESGFAAKILRPLCAQNLQPTQMELDGLVDREKLLNISGRSRKPQMALAEQWNITEYPSPAGGCRLTEPGYALRLKDLLDNEESVDEENVNEDELSLLRYGRHFRTKNGNKIIVARTKEEGDAIKGFINKEYYSFHPSKFSGALVVMTGKNISEDIELAARLAVRYSKGKNEEKVSVRYGVYGERHNTEIEVSSISDNEIEEILINNK